MADFANKTAAEARSLLATFPEDGSMGLEEGDGNDRLDRIIQNISDATGEAIKFADGTLICRYNTESFLENSLTNLTTAPEQGLTIYNRQYEWGFPYAFINERYSAVMQCDLRQSATSVKFQSIFANVSSKKPSRCTFNLTGLSTFNRAYNPTLFAIGKWK